MSLSDLKPCPFCGNADLRITPNGIGDFYVICDTDFEGEMSCGASSSDRSCETEEGAAQRWNSRAEGVAALQQAGWVLVPKEPTEEMRLACWRQQYVFHGATPTEAATLAQAKVEDADQRANDRAGYEAMIAAAPLPQQTALVEEGLGGDSRADLSRASSSQRLSRAGICRVDLDGDDLDDISITGDQIAMLRLERMDKGHVWGNVSLQSGRSIRLSFHAKTALSATAEWEG